MLALLACVVLLLVVMPALFLGLTKAFMVYIAKPRRNRGRLAAAPQTPPAPRP